ncbi:MAG: hypothetical protein ACEPOZ_14230 [Marinifilaceae bacterium]
MENLDLNHLGVYELNPGEIKKIEGGFFPLVIGAVVVLTSAEMGVAISIGIAAGGVVLSKILKA